MSSLLYLLVCLGYNTSDILQQLQSFSYSLRKEEGKEREGERGESIKLMKIIIAYMVHRLQSDQSLCPVSVATPPSLSVSLLPVDTPPSRLL